MPFRYLQGKPVRSVAAGSTEVVVVDSTGELLAVVPTAVADSIHQCSSGYADGWRRYFAVEADATAVVVVDHPNPAGVDWD